MCSVGEELGESCETDITIFQPNHWIECRRVLLLSRVGAELERPLNNLLTCCYTHYVSFISAYEDYQLRKGCCDPLRLHQHRVQHDLQRVTEDMSFLYANKFPFLLPGRYICQHCVVAIPRFANNLAPEIMKDYDFDNLSEMYHYCTSRHSHALWPSLRPDQAKCIHSLLLGNDTLCVLPTAGGKTAIIVLPGFMKSKLTGTKKITIIVYPMNSIINEQMSRMQQQELHCSILTSHDSSTLNIQNELCSLQNGDPYYILCHPENLEQNHSRQLFVRWAESISYVMVDEAHTIYDWSQTFRPAFGRVGRVRTFLRSTLGLLTATFTKDMINGVMDACRLSVSQVNVIARNPDRPEIFLELRRKTNIKTDLEFLVQEARLKMINMSRTLVFLRTTNETSDANYWFRTSLVNNGQVLKDGKLFDYISDHVTSNTGAVTQRRVCNLFSSTQKCLQVLFTTIFYGMGMDNPTVENVILYDCDVNPASIFQKIGRVARREGTSGRAIIFATKKMRTMVFAQGVCIRKCILEKLVGYRDPNYPEIVDCDCMNTICRCMKCTCCSVCAKTCHCSSDTFPDDDDFTDDDEDADLDEDEDEVI